MPPGHDAPTRDPGAPGEVIHRGLWLLAMSTWLAVVVMCLPRLVAGLGHDPWGDAGIWLLVAHHVLLLVGLLRWSRSTRLVTVAGALLVLGWLLLMPHWRHLPLGTLWAPGYLGFPWAVWTAMTLPRPRRAVAVAVWTVFVGLGLADLLLLLWRDWPPPGIAVLLSLWFLVPTSPVLLFGDALRWMVWHLERQIARREAWAREGEELRAQAMARAEAARLLHDHVLHALHAVAHVGDGQVTARMASRECRAALQELDRPRRAEPTARVADILADDPLVRAMGIVPDGDTGPLPADVADAMAAAARAALANVRAHARATTASLVLRQAGAVARVEVRDDGVGFHPERIPANRLGVRQSIQGRMEDVGGQASVVSAPGQGTQVLLSWPRMGKQGPDPAWRAAARRRLDQLLVRTAWPGMLASLVAWPLLAPTTGGWPVVVTLVVLLVGLWGSRSFVAGGAAGRRAVVFLGVSVTGWWLAVLGMGDVEVTHQHQLWPLWACAALLHLAVLCLPPRRAVLAVLGWTAVMVAGLEVLHPGLDWRGLYSIWLIPAGDGLMTVAVLVVFQRLVARQLTERELTERGQHAAARVRQAATLQEFWSTQVTGEAMALMRQVASGGGAVDAAQVQHALLLEATLRDELLLGPDQPRILAVLNDLRRRGWHINTPSVTPEERVFLDGMAYWTEKIGDPAWFKQEVMVTMSGGQAVLVVLQPSADQVALWTRTAAAMGAELDHDEHFARLRMDLPEVPGDTYSI